MRKMRGSKTHIKLLISNAQGSGDCPVWMSHWPACSAPEKVYMEVIGECRYAINHKHHPPWLSFSSFADHTSPGSRTCRLTRRRCRQCRLSVHHAGLRSWLRSRRSSECVQIMSSYTRRLTTYQLAGLLCSTISGLELQACGGRQPRRSDSVHIRAAVWYALILISHGDIQRRKALTPGRSLRWHCQASRRLSQAE
jgi:hypothetical protein